MPQLGVLGAEFKEADRLVNETVRGIKALMDRRYITAIYAVIRLNQFTADLIDIAKENEAERETIESLEAAIRGVSGADQKNSFAVYGYDGIVDVYVTCRLDSLADANELIDKIVKAKNVAFPSGFQEHKAKMEGLLSGVKDD